MAITAPAIKVMAVNSPTSPAGNGTELRQHYPHHAPFTAFALPHWLYHTSAARGSAIADGKFTSKEATALRARAKLDPLEARIKGLWFMEKDEEGYRQLWQLSQTEGVNPEERRVLDRMLSKKREAMFRKHEGRQVNAAKALP